MTADTVLLVEDEPLVRTVAMIVIEEEIGCRCEIAANRDEALRLLQDQRLPNRDRLHGCDDGERNRWFGTGPHCKSPMALEAPGRADALHAARLLAAL